MRFRSTLAAMVLLLAGRPACAWNGTGHKIIALIAWQDLTPAARERVTGLLKAHRDYADMLTKADTPEQEKSRAAFLTAATWPDLVRTPGGKSYRYNKPAWHFIDYPYAIGVDQPAAPDENWDPAKEPVNAAQAWQKNVADLNDPNAADANRAMALCWVEHLAGDIHQPLHAVSLFSARFPKGDQGGNLVLVTVGGKVTNLHAAWDPMLGTDESFDNIGKQAARICAAHPRKDLAEPLKVTDFHAWVLESEARAKAVVYAGGTLSFLTRDEHDHDQSKPVPALPDAYLEKARATADECAALAGYRLADRLNAWLGQ